MAETLAWQAAVARRLDVDAVRLTWREQGGSALNATWCADSSGVRWFVKVNGADRLPMFEAEAAGLAELAASNAVRVPQPLATGREGAHAFLVLEWLDVHGGGHDAALGRALAVLHRHTAPRFGWHRDSTIGTTPQENGWCDDWCAFFGERRLAPQLARVAAGGDADLAAAGRRVIAALPALLAGHAPSPSLLHGDLWGGNAGALATGEPVIFDPAVYYGDREADLAMTELFGGFGRPFYAAYEAAWPLPPGYPRRRRLYNLYHVLNHANLFGGGYRAQARAMIDALLAGR
ncbi:MAG: fructosamine kinase family protein [Betaproteobacteria bacterium]|nr:fructosamine kinase family protein [Betaproteobacteria bacterium]